AADRVGSQQSGWGLEDQLALQVLACQKAEEVQGILFNSGAALKAHAESTDAMLKALAGSLEEEYITRSLSVTSLSGSDTTTTNPVLNLRGSADPNFPLYLNGKEVPLTNHGFFSFNADLALGVNTFTFTHKGVTTSYTVTYRLQVLKTISPAANLTVDGGGTLSVSATARTGASLYAMLNGTRIPMKPADRQADEAGDQEAGYDNYSGTYTLPAGIVDKAQNLGAVTVYATFEKTAENKTGGKITVRALPKPPPPEQEPEEKPVALADLKPVNPNGGGRVLATGDIVIVKKDYAETFDGDTVDDYSRPTNAYLPRGTTDVVVKSVYDAASDSQYYLLGCGRRVYQQDVEPYIQNGKLTSNTIKGLPVARTAASTSISFAADWRVPYNLQLLPKKYISETFRNYGVTAATTEYIEITFSYTETVSGELNLAGDPLFSKAEWISGSGTDQKLRLYLKQTGVFYGYTAVWDNDGQLTFTFRYPLNVSGNASAKPLTGVRIMLDPGHGGKSIGTAGGNIAEKTLVLKYALQLRDKLTALGATVGMTRTTDVYLELAERVDKTREFNADLFVSVHMNGLSNANACGPSLHYFNEYSMLLAKNIFSQVKGVYDSYKASSPYGYRWDPFYVTRVQDIPSVLIECGFMTNANDLERLISDSFMNKLTTAVASGLTAYCQSLPKVTPNPTPLPTTTAAATAAPVTNPTAATAATEDPAATTADETASSAASANPSETAASETASLPPDETGTTAAEPTATAATTKAPP
ncbi:MAG: N-acetylmuramoyl-L-alanine amidase, partial [Oscillospiraceae bacterium]|nr:N-acetylmuramoyl-L-alanine amidase [Oscillospiraceae bacterium]